MSFGPTASEIRGRIESEHLLDSGSVGDCVRGYGPPRKERVIGVFRFLWFAVRHPILTADALFDPGNHDTGF